MSKSREERAKALEKWADTVDASELRLADTQALRTIAELVDQRTDVDEQITEAVISARQSNRSWSEIGAMLGVSKQAAQRKYSSKASSART
jgi:acyl-CoA reductase-like NAD-dependent aldehyde dehydrogenase